MNLDKHKRLARMNYAIKREENIRNMELPTDFNYYKKKGIARLKEEAGRCFLFTPDYLPFYIRIERLNLWNKYMFDEVGLNDLLEFVESVHAIEADLQDLEDKIAEKGIKINEKLFKEFCEGKLPKVDRDAESERDMTPVCSSTPVREIKPKVLNKSVKNVKTVKKESTPYVQQTPQLPGNVALLLKNNKSDLIPIGPNGTTVSRKALKSINWSQSGPNVTRKLLMEIFDRETLASHTLSGKPSPAFLDCNKPLKGQLDENKVADLIHMVTSTYKMSAKEVRQSVTTKCADENKMYRQRMERLNNKLTGKNNKRQK